MCKPKIGHNLIINCSLLRHWLFYVLRSTFLVQPETQCAIDGESNVKARLGYFSFSVAFKKHEAIANWGALNGPNGPKMHDAERIQAYGLELTEVPFVWALRKPIRTKDQTDAGASRVCENSWVKKWNDLLFVYPKTESHS
ncbi:hypothetical protein L6164_003955 [Bauhinia variegata]|uniref:Uncharacterized protein n=1 Tax=Bauhinia variegata TaxID=167791 RepID=A0ACB9Q551_BAUVA|nr:hypothetical protein L6164_003955 [Bauhinia variegata]